MWELLVNLVIRPPRAQYDPARALPGPALRVDNKNFVRTDLQLIGSQGHKLECSHYTPEVWPAETLPCVVFLHGNSGCRVDAYDAVRVLLPLNITVFCLDLSGSGLSEGQYITLGVRESEDLRSVMAHLRETGKCSKIGLWGRSMGAATSLFYGQKDPSVAALVLDSPFSRLTDLMLELVDTFTGDRGLHIPRPLVRLAVQFLRMSIKRKAKFDILELDVIAAAKGSFVPALFGHAKGDKFILPHHTDDIFAIYPGDKNVITFEGGHNTVRSQFFFDSVSIFFLNTLHPPGAPVNAADIPRSPDNPHQATFTPISAELEMLLCMGFPKHIAERALRKHRTVELASNWLVENADNGWLELREGELHVRTEVEVVEAAEPKGHQRPGEFSGELGATPWPVDYDHVRSPRSKSLFGDRDDLERPQDDATLEDLTDDELARAIELSFGTLVNNDGGGVPCGGAAAGGGSSSCSGGGAVMDKR